MTYQQIGEVLRDADLEGLIETGAPVDEYDSEAKQIAHELAKADEVTQAKVISIMSAVWEAQFGHPYATAPDSWRSAFRAAAARIASVSGR